MQTDLQLIRTLNEDLNRVTRADVDNPKGYKVHFLRKKIEDLKITLPPQYYKFYLLLYAKWYKILFDNSRPLSFREDKIVEGWSKSIIDCKDPKQIEDLLNSLENDKTVEDPAYLILKSKALYKKYQLLKNETY
jgi:hypothetical protein